MLFRDFAEDRRGILACTAGCPRQGVDDGLQQGRILDCRLCGFQRLLRLFAHGAILRFVKGGIFRHGKLYPDASDGLKQLR